MKRLLLLPAAALLLAGCGSSGHHHDHVVVKTVYRCPSTAPIPRVTHTVPRTTRSTATAKPKATQPSKPKVKLTKKR